MRIPSVFWAVVGVVFVLSNTQAAEPKTAVEFKERGNNFYRMGEYEKAFADFTKAIDLDPKYAHAFNNRGNVYKKKGKYTEAIADYTKAIDLDPKSDAAFYNRGRVFCTLKKYTEAIADYTKAIDLDPKSDDVLIERGNAYSGLNEYSQAIVDYTKAIDVNPKSAVAYNNRGLAYGDLSNYTQAINDYTQAIDLNPKFNDAFYHRGNAHVVKGKLDAAIADYTKAIDLDPNYARALNNRGHAYDEKGKYALALADYLESIRLDPNGKLAPGNLKLLIKKLNSKSIGVKIEGVKLDREVSHVETKDKIVSLDEGQSTTVGEEVTVKHEVAFTTAERVETGVQRSDKSKEESNSQYNSTNTRSANARLGPSWLNIGGELGNSTGETWGTIRGWESEVCTSIRTSIEKSKAWTKGIETKTTVSVTIAGKSDGQKVRVIWRDEYRTGIATVSIDGTTIEIPIAFRIGSDITTETVKASVPKK